jgi:hypothetical protein
MNYFYYALFFVYLEILKLLSQQLVLELWLASD